MKPLGMNLQFEAYPGPFNTVEGSALADIPMGEFWTGRRGNIYGPNGAQLTPHPPSASSIIARRSAGCVQRQRAVSSSEAMGSK